ncbi:MAG: metal-sensitive transcriptional regulator [Anaerolineales bacterium]
MEAATVEDVKRRLKRIEGQVRGVSKMLDDGRDCQEIIQQLTAIRSAAQQTSAMLAKSYACQCLEDTKSTKNTEALIENLIDVLSKAS